MPYQCYGGPAHGALVSAEEMTCNRIRIPYLGRLEASATMPVEVQCNPPVVCRHALYERSGDVLLYVGEWGGDD